MSDEAHSGVCPHCSRTGGGVGKKCDEAVCQRQGYHYIPEKYAAALGTRQDSGEFADPQIGRVVDRYLVVGKIGQGGMGAVYLALQMPLEREVALKMIPGVTLDETSRGRFEREAKAISSLYHPNIVQLFEYGFSPTSGAPFMALEFVKGGRELMDEIIALRDARIPWAADRVARIFGQVLSALQTAHSHGLVHRDIKPQNIMLVDVEGNADFVKILDFGLARTLQHVPGMDRLTGTGTVVGTPQYIAPEQLVAGREIDSRSDLYSVGAALFEVVTGLTAYPGVDPRAVLALKLDPDYDPVSRIPPGAMHAPLRNLLARCMARNPRRRYDSAVEMREALVEALDGAPPLGRTVLPGGDRASLLAVQSTQGASPAAPAPDAPVDPSAQTVISDSGDAPGTMEISSFERPSQVGMDTLEEDLQIPERAPMNLILAGALTGVVLLVAALVVIFVVLPALDEGEPASLDASATPSMATRPPVTPPGPVHATGVQAADAWTEPGAGGEGASDAGGVVEDDLVVDETHGGKKKVKKPVDADASPSADPGGSVTTGDPPVDPGVSIPADDPVIPDPGSVGADPGPVVGDPPTGLVKSKLASLADDVAACLPSAQGKVTVAVVVNAQTGRPLSTKVSGFYPGGVQTSQCIKQVVQGLEVAPFEGENLTVPYVYDFGESQEPLPETLSDSEIKAKLSKAKGWMVACAAGLTGKVMVQITVQGETGRVGEAVVMNPPFAATKEGDCMEKALEKMLKFSPFAQDSVTFTHTFSL